MPHFNTQGCGNVTAYCCIYGDMNYDVDTGQLCWTTNAYVRRVELWWGDVLISTQSSGCVCLPFPGTFTLRGFSSSSGGTGFLLKQITVTQEQINSVCTCSFLEGFPKQVTVFGIPCHDAITVIIPANQTSAFVTLDTNCGPDSHDSPCGFFEWNYIPGGFLSVWLSCHWPGRSEIGFWYMLKGTEHPTNAACYGDAGDSFRTLTAWPMVSGTIRGLGELGILDPENVPFGGGPIEYEMQWKYLL